MRGLERFPPAVLTGLGVFAVGSPPTWYIFARLEAPTSGQIQTVEAILLSTQGEPMTLTLEDLFKQRPHFLTTGPGAVILTALAVYELHRQR